jgi:hypothetical protein
MRHLMATLIAAATLSLGANAQVQMRQTAAPELGKRPERVLSVQSPPARTTKSSPVAVRIAPRLTPRQNRDASLAEAQSPSIAHLPQLMPDLEALPFSVNGVNNSTSAHPPGIGELPQTFTVRNNGGRPTVGFAFRLSCRVKANEFDLGACLYKSYQDAVNHTGAAENSDLLGIASLPGPGETIQAHYNQDYWVNCRSDMGGRCAVSFEPDFQHKVVESNESNNKFTVFFD